jgi:hypothetical protein
MSMSVWRVLALLGAGKILVPVTGNGGGSIVGRRGGSAVEEMVCFLKQVKLFAFGVDGRSPFFADAEFIGCIRRWFNLDCESRNVDSHTDRKVSVLVTYVSLRI